jgi:hypothetical protein
MAGWDNFDEPLDYQKSYVYWHIGGRYLYIKYFLAGAVRSKQYQVGVHIACNTIQDSGNFGSFPTSGCSEDTRQGVTRIVHAAELGAVTTDAFGRGCFFIKVGPIEPGNYSIHFHARDSVGHNLENGFDHPGAASVDFQSPGPFGTMTTIRIR